MPRSHRQIGAPAPVLASPEIRRLDRVVRLLAPKDVSVTFIGESGAGKEVFARRLHDLSPRCAGPFIPINCAAIPEALFESELFGHERGAFTGATERVRGKVEAADGGTLFLDEVAEMPLGAQAKLLRFLEHRRFMRVGGSTKLSVDVRLVTATLRPLEDEVKAGRFRGDLFYRIEGITLRVPPLRERRADIDPLVARFVADLTARHHTEPPRITRATRAALHAYDWPGNVRELWNALQLVCLLREGEVARVADLPHRIAAHAARDPREPRSGARDTLVVRLDEPLDDTVDRVLAAALALEDGNRSRTARRLSVGLRTVQRFAARVGGG